MKKKELTRKLSLVFVVLIFFVAFLETEIYYWDIITNKCYLLLQGILDGLRIFGIKSSLDIFDIIKAEQLNSNLAMSILNHAYIICYFGAPLITAKYIAQFIGYIVKEKLIDFNIKGKKDRILIVGYNGHVEKLLKNTLYKSKDKKSEEYKKSKRKILVLHKKDINEKTKFRFQMSGVSFLNYEKLDYENVTDRKMILKWILPKSIKRIVLFEEKGMDNVSNYCFFLKCFEQADCCGFVNDLQMDCNYDISQVEKLMWDCFDKKNVNLKYSMNTFSIPMLRAQSVLEKTKIYDNIIDENGECKDVHLLIVGFGKMGKRFFKRAINESVVSEKNNITVDIIEKDVRKIKQYIGRIHKNYYGSDGNTICVNSDVVEGNLKIRFHSVDVVDEQFVECIDSISKDNAFTYIAICVDNPDAGVASMITVEDFLQRKEQNVPLLVRMDSGQQLKQLEEIYSNLKLVPGDDEIMSLDNIRSNELETVSNNIHKRDSEEQRNKVRVAYQIESRKYRVLHYKVKSAIYEKMSDLDKENVEKAFSSMEYTNKAKIDEFTSGIKENRLLFEFGSIEHRRWSYYIILNGWSYKNIKDEKNKVTPYLCPFSEIINNVELKKSAYYEYKDWYEIITKIK